MIAYTVDAPPLDHLDRRGSMQFKPQDFATLPSRCRRRYF
jgi:hypothetical protein